LATLGLVSGLVVVGLACEALRSSRPILEIDEYEAMLVGRADAVRVGTEKCLQACHHHDDLRRDFDASTMGPQLLATGDQVDCEDCHGPGSVAIADLTPERIAEDAAAGIETSCDFESLTDIRNLPAPARSLICLKCHSGISKFNLTDWTAGAHSQADVSCSDCHPIHAGPLLIVPQLQRSEMCVRCHGSVYADFSQPSRHPVPEGRMSCSDCHDPHSAAERMLKERTVQQTCARCHAEAAAPFAFAHAEVTTDCTNCHRNHGSATDNILKVSEPFLCLQCHRGHALDDPAGGPTSLESRAAFNTRCSNCHTSVHGSDIPSPSGDGTFIR
jgi:DmsE family decaheme c-type cytochrome